MASNIISFPRRKGMQFSLIDGEKNEIIELNKIMNTLNMASAQEMAIELQEKINLVNKAYVVNWKGAPTIETGSLLADHPYIADIVIFKSIAAWNVFVNRMQDA